VACNGAMMSGACWSQESVRKPLARAHCKRRRCLRFLTNSILNQQLWNLAKARGGHALILHCQAGAAPAGGEGVQGERVTREQSAVMYPQSAKIQLFVGIGKRGPAHVGSSEGEENDVGKLGCSVRRGFRINELLHCRASEQYRSELLFPNKTKRNKTKRENYESNYLNLLFHLGCKQRFVAVQSSGVRTGRRACLALRQRPLQPPDAAAFVPETRTSPAPPP
jgi:hypothetical protein